MRVRLGSANAPAPNTVSTARWRAPATNTDLLDDVSGLLGVLLRHLLLLDGLREVVAER